MRAPAPILLAALLLCPACVAGEADDADGDDAGDADDAGDDSGDDGGDDSSQEPDELAGITAAHNQVRAAHGVAPLTWTPALAAVAQAWAEGCADQEAPLGLIDHNQGRSESYGTYVGENVYGSSGPSTGPDAVAAWASEEASYDYESNGCDGVCGHYTQIVWAATTELGCGSHACPGLAYGNTIVCDYAPGGNDGGRPY
jgi:uncharacterized protein YkwD